TIPPCTRARTAARPAHHPAHHSLVGVFPALAAAPPPVTVSLSLPGAPPIFPDEAVSVFCPTVGLSVQLPTVATPLAFVVWLPPVIVPSPGATPNVTATPATWSPCASFTSTDGGELTAVPAGDV